MSSIHAGYIMPVTSTSNNACGDFKPQDLVSGPSWQSATAWQPVDPNYVYTFPDTQIVNPTVIIPTTQTVPTSTTVEPGSAVGWVTYEQIGIAIANDYAVAKVDLGDIGTFRVNAMESHACNLRGRRHGLALCKIVDDLLREKIEAREEIVRKYHACEGDGSRWEDLFV